VVIRAGASILKGVTDSIPVGARVRHATGDVVGAGLVVEVRARFGRPDDEVTVHWDDYVARGVHEGRGTHLRSELVRLEV
jgi:hypothetical protein